MTRTPLDILIAHRGGARVYDTVAAVLKAGYRARFAASYYHDPDGWIDWITRHLPGGLQSRLRAYLYRRHDPALDPAYVDGSVLDELASWLLTRLPGAGREGLPALRWRDRRSARLVRRLRPRAVMVPDGTALLTFEAAKSVGTFCLLDQAIGFVGAYGDVLKREAALHPDRASSLQMPSEALVARVRAEVLMADHIIAGSEYVRDSLTDVGADPDSISILPYGVDTERFVPAPRPPGGKLRILFAGAIGTRKGVPYLLEAVRKLGRDDIALTLLGGIEPPGDWLAPFAKWFRHIPHLPHHEVHRAFQDADIFVFPSLHEGSAVCVYEALACGLPVITTPNAGSVVRDGMDGFIAPIQDADALGARIAQLADDADLRARMASSARARAQEFTWDAYDARLSAILASLLGRPGHGAEG